MAGERRGGIEEAPGRRDLASVHPPTLLAAAAQTVCSQQYMHLLVLFQEIITPCVIACGCEVRLSALSQKVASEPRRGGRRTMRSSDSPKCTRKRACLSRRVCQTLVLNVSGGENNTGLGARESAAPDIDSFRWT